MSGMMSPSPTGYGTGPSTVGVFHYRYCGGGGGGGGAAAAAAASDDGDDGDDPVRPDTE